jgi:hypothetical protein
MTPNADENCGSCDCAGRRLCGLPLAVGPWLACEFRIPVDLVSAGQWFPVTRKGIENGTGPDFFILSTFQVDAYPFLRDRQHNICH